MLRHIKNLQFREYLNICEVTWDLLSLPDCRLKYKLIRVQTEHNSLRANGQS